MNLKELREEFATLHGQSGALVSKAAQEKRALTSEEKQENEKRYARMDELKSLADDVERQAKYAFAEMKETGEETVQVAEQPKGRAAFEANKPGREFTLPELRSGINQWCKTGQLPQNMFTTISTSGSSIMLPKTVLGPEQVRRNNNAIRAAIASQGYTPIETGSTEQIVLPVWDDTGNTGAALTESATSDTSADSTYTGSITLNGTLYQSKSKWFSNTMIMSEQFDVLSYVGPILQKMLDKAQESAWSTTLKAATNITVTASHTAVTYAELLKWEHALAVAYRSDAVFILSDSLYKLFRGLVDGNTRPIMDLDPQNSFQASIHGKKVFVSDYFDTFDTVNHFGGAFCSADALKIRDVVPQRLTKYMNIPTYPDQTGFNLYANGDFGFIQSGVNLLETAAS